MQALGIMGSPRRTGNTSILLQEIMQILARDLDTEIVNIADFKIEPCISCYSCLESGQCCLQDEMFYDQLLSADAIIIASPAYFGSVPGPLKIAMDRTWCLRGRLAGKVGGSVVVGRRYIENTLTTLNTFFLRHGMILNSRGVIGYAEKAGEIRRDSAAFQDGRRLAESIVWMLQKIAR
jgi:multimeric flavodoxin WrbA